MFGRVAACSVAALLVALATPSRAEPADVTAVDAPRAAAATTSSHAAELPHDQSRADGQDGTPATAKIAALDPAQPPIKSPALTNPAIALPDLPEPFGLHAVAVQGGNVLAKWNGVEAEIRAESEVLAHCRNGAAACPTAAQNFLAIIAQGSARTGRARVGVINRAINLAIQPMSDLAQWGVPDRWSAPLDTLSTHRGDCEDYAIAKYVALREAGVAAADVRLVIVHDIAANEDHAVTAARLDGDWIMLDNRWLTLIEDRDMRRVIPLFVLDDTGVRQFAPAIMPGARPASLQPPSP